MAGEHIIDRRTFLKSSIITTVGIVSICSQTEIVVAEPQVNWTFSNEFTYGADPELYEGKLYHAQENGSVFAFDAVTGDTRWSAQTGANHVQNGLAASESNLATIGEDNTLTVLDRETGDQKWQRSVSKTGEAVAWSPDGATLYALSAHNSPTVGSYQVDGTPNWRTELAYGYQFHAEGALIAQGSRVICAGVEGVSVLDADDGSVSSSTSIDDYDLGEAKSIHVDDNVIFTTNDDYAFAVDISAESVLWKYEASDPVIAGYDDELIYLGGQNGIYAVDKTSGQARWDSGIAVNDNGINLVGDYLYAIAAEDDMGLLYKVEAATGLEEWKTTLIDDEMKYEAVPPQVYQGNVLATAQPDSNFSNTHIWAISDPNLPSATPTATSTATDTPKPTSEPTEVSTSERAASTQSEQTATTDSAQASGGNSQQTIDEPAANGRGLFTNGDGENPLGIKADAISMTAISAVMGGVGALAALAQMRGDD